MAVTRKSTPATLKLSVYKMKKIALAVSLLLASYCVVNAQVPGGGGANVPVSPGGFSCTVSGCTPVVNGPFTFNGPDGTPQFATGSTALAAEYWMAVGGITGAGASFVATGAASNISGNFTAKGNANVNFGNSGSGQLAQALDPGGTVSSGGQVQLTPSRSSGPVKVGNSTYGFNLDVGSSNVSQIGGFPLTSDFTGYIVGNWYAPSGPALITSGVAPGTGSIRLYPAYIKQTVTLNSLGVRITTAAAAGNCQLAIYANNAATGRPTGSALASTASISTTATGSLNSAVSIQLTQGLYWWAVNCDNATVTLTSIATTDMWFSRTIGSPTQSGVPGTGAANSGVGVTQTFGTWPSLTAGSFTEGGGGTFPIVQFKPASIP